MGNPAPVGTRSSFRGAGRTLERIVWRFRSYVVPSHFWTYWSIVRQHGLKQNNVGSKFVCFDFTKVDIDIETGRYVFSLVRDFEALGYLVCYRRNYRFLATMRHKAHKRLLLNRPFCVCKSVNELPEGSLAVEVTD